MKKTLALLGGLLLLFACKSRPATRGEEIAAYLKDNPCDNYVILDDDRDMLPSQQAHFVPINDEFGLTDTERKR